MNINNNVFNFLMSGLLVFFIHSSAGAFQAEVLPSEIHPGDAFTITVSGEETEKLPPAVFNRKQINFGSCGDGCFIAIGAVDIETKPGIYPIHLSVSGDRIPLELVVKPTSFPEVSLTLPAGKVFLNPEDLKRAQREAERLKLLWQRETDKLWKGNFVFPLENEISTVFGTKRIINKRKNSLHKGIDIRGKMGEEVNASNSGRVVLADKLFFGGKTVVLDHGYGIYTIYMHLSAFNVRHGAIVSKGDIIGFVGASGRATGPHLHFGVKVLGVNTNPVSFVKLKL